MLVSIIVAAAENGVIGKDNQLIWHLPNDLKRFKALTLGHPIIMGRKTFESIGRPLPGRTSIVITHQKKMQIAGAVVVNSFQEALMEANKLSQDEVFIIGGGEIFKTAIPLCDKLYLTLVKAKIEGDVYIDLSVFKNWVKTHSESHGIDEKHGLEYDFIDLERDNNEILDQ